MPSIYTADEILLLARDIAKVPDTGATGSEDADLLRLANAYLQSVLAPAVLSVHEAYFDRAVRQALVASTSRYRIHSRAMLGKVTAVRYANSSGDYDRVLTLIARGKREHLRSLDLDAAAPTAYWLEGSYIMLYPDIGTNATGYLEQVVPMRPGDLVLSTAARVVASVDSTTQVTLSSAVPSGWSTASTFDIHSKYSGAELKCWDRAAGTVSGTTVEFSSAIDGTGAGEVAVEAGDYVCLAGECAVPAVPRELHSVLSQGLAVKLSESWGDIEAVKAHKVLLDESLRVVGSELKPRVSAQPKAIKGLPFLRMHGR